MNRQRRREIDGLIASLEELARLCADQAEIVAAIADDEEEYRDNIPENLQQTDRFERADEAAEQLRSAAGLIEEIDFESIIEVLREAQA